MNASEAYRNALSYGYSKELEDIACTHPFCAYIFADTISGFNIIKCQEASCRDVRYAYLFAKNIVGADILYCCKYIIKNSYLAKEFIKNCPQHIDLIKKSVRKNSKWHKIINEMIINKILT